MKKTIYLLSIILVSMILSSCEEVIILDLKTTDPRVVIEADLDGTTGTLEVRCSKTNDFYADSAFLPVSDAEVVLLYGKDDSQTVSETEPGIYILEGFTVVPGSLYRIEVTIDDITYEAQAIAPKPAQILEVIIEPVEIQGPPPEIRFLGIGTAWLDIPDEENFYCLRMTVNNKLPGSKFLIEDTGQDGELLLVTEIRDGLENGDSLQFQLSAINKEVYEYFQQVDDMGANGFSAAAPYNPIGNFSNDALGFFGVCFTNKKEVVIEE